MRYTRLTIVLMMVAVLGLFTGPVLADHQSIKGRQPALKIISPVNGATISNPILVVFETSADMSKMTIDKMMTGGKTDMMRAGPHLHVDLGRRVTMPTTKLVTKVGMNRYQYSLGNAKAGNHTIRVYWGDAKHHKPLGTVQTVRVIVK